MIPVDRHLVAAVLDRLVPADEWPSATGAGALAYLDEHARDRHAHLWQRTLAAGFADLDAEAVVRGGPFAGLPADEQDALLRDLESRSTRGTWSVDPARFTATVVRLAAEAYYAPRGAPSWSMVGYDAGPKRDAGPGDANGAARTARLRLGDADDAYDVVVIGAGAGGGTAAAVIAEAGARVLLVDRGGLLAPDAIGRDHLANHRLLVYGLNTPPAHGEAADPRVVVTPGGEALTVTRPTDRRYHVMPLTVGGGSRVYQGMAWRLLPEDFRLASRYGVAEGSSLAD